MLAEPPRRVPPVLWIRLAFGGMGQVIWLALAVITGSVLIATHTHAPVAEDDIPVAWFAIIGWGICAPIYGLVVWRAHRALYMLRQGRETRGRLLGKREVDQGETSFWHYVFEYTAENGVKQTVTVKTEVREPRLEDETTEAMLYDPSGRRAAITLDHLPGYPAIENGELVARNTRVWHVLLVPTITVILTVLLVLR